MYLHIDLFWKEWGEVKFILLHCLLVASMFGIALDVSGAGTELPQRLSDTGLYVAGSTTTVRTENLAFSPQYPLWSDGAVKRRWLYLPPGTAIDASHPEAWEFPPGTRLWKEFGYSRPVETRFIERLGDGSWRFSAYFWNADGSDAVLAPPEGIARHPVSEVPGGIYSIPARSDCRACHDGAAVPVLGVSALQLSPDRDPLAPHAERISSDHIDLRGLAARGLLRNFPPAQLDRPPRIAARTPASRAALGYMHGNCGHCHNDVGPLASLELSLAQGLGAAANVATSLNSLIHQSSRYRPRAVPSASQRVVPGRPDLSVLALRMHSRNPLMQMPPVGTQLADAEGLALVERWIHHDLPISKENAP
jgi:hypothetical protein